MAKGDIWYLRDQRDNNRIVAKIEITDDYCSGTCYEAYAWYTEDTPAEWYYVAGFSCKWDSCTHWYFRGEDYDKEFPKSHDSYYHLCGSDRFANHIRSMCFIWKIAAIELCEYDKYKPETKKDIIRYYFNDDTNKLIELMLDGYTIEKESKTNE